MIQKIFITTSIFLIFLLGIRFLKKISIFNSLKSKKSKKEENIVDLEKDPKTNEYRPKQ